MGELAIDEDLVGWAASFMSGQAIRMTIDGHEGEEIGIMTGLPQGSPISPCSW